MDVENLIIGIIFFIIGVSILVYKFVIIGDKDDEIGFKHNSIGGAIILILLAIHLLSQEVEKII